MDGAGHVRWGRGLAVAVVAAVVGLVGGVGCGGGGAAGLPGGGGGGADTVDRTRDLSAFIVDGFLVGLPGEVPMGAVPATATRTQIDALRSVNAYRAALDLSPISMDEALNAAATAHAACRAAYDEHYETLPSEAEEPHWEAPCSGVDPAARLDAVGGAASFVAECNAGAPSAPVAVDRWMAGLYERLPIVYATTAACGYGNGPSGAAAANVLNCDRRAPAGRFESEPVLWPKHGAEEVGTTWAALDGILPDGVPRGWSSGPIISMTWAGETFEVLSHELLGPGGAPVEHVFVDAATDPRLVGWDTVALIPSAPLAVASSYLVILEVRDGKGDPRTVDWAFHTRGTAG